MFSKWPIVGALTMASGKLFQLRIVLGTKEYIWYLSLKEVPRTQASVIASKPFAVVAFRVVQHPGQLSHSGFHRKWVICMPATCSLSF